MRTGPIYEIAPSGDRRTDAAMRADQYSWFERLLCRIRLHDFRHTGLLPSGDEYAAGRECRRCWLFIGHRWAKRKKRT